MLIYAFQCHLSLAADPFEVPFFEQVKFKFISFDIKNCPTQSNTECCYSHMLYEQVKLQFILYDF